MDGLRNKEAAGGVVAFRVVAFVTIKNNNNNIVLHKQAIGGMQALER